MYLQYRNPVRSTIGNTCMSWAHTEHSLTLFLNTPINIDISTLFRVAIVHGAWFLRSLGQEPSKWHAASPLHHLLYYLYKRNKNLPAVLLIVVFLFLQPTTEVLILSVLAPPTRKQKNCQSRTSQGTTLPASFSVKIFLWSVKYISQRGQKDIANNSSLRRY